MKINFTDVPDAPSFEPVPAGWYILHIVDSSVEEGKESGIPYFKVDAVIDEPAEFAGKHVFPNLSTSADALQYGLKPLLKVTGHNPDGELDVSNELLIGLKFGAKLRIKKQEGYDDKNEIRSYGTLDEAYEQIAKRAASEGSLLPG